MRHCYFLAFTGFLALATLFGCKGGKDGVAVDCRGVYFCLGGFMHQELDRFDSMKPSIDKYVYLNGTEERHTLQLDRTRWEAEFTAFREADIDKPALVGKYLVDTLFMDTDSLTRVSYIAQDPDLRTRYLHLYFKPNATEPTYLEARLETKNVFYQSVQELEYTPGESYGIKGFQDIWLLGEDTFAVKSVFVK